MASLQRSTNGMRANPSCRLLSSPGSSDEAASTNGSPDTKLTPFSPGDARSTNPSESRLAGSIAENRYLCAGQVSSDPFLASPGVPNRHRLSPTAAAFTPVGISADVPSDGSSHNQNHAMAQAGLDFPASPEISRVGGQRMSSTHTHFVSPQSSGPSALSRTVTDRFDVERRGHAMMIDNVPRGVSYIVLANLFDHNELPTLKGPAIGELAPFGKIYVAFADSRETKRAMRKIERYHPEWHCTPITARQYVEHAEPALLERTSDFEGQLQVTVYYDGRNPRLSRHTAGHTLQALAMTFGDVMFFSSLPSAQENVCEFHIEYFNTRHAENAAIGLNGATPESYVFEVSQFKPDLNPATRRHPVASRLGADRMYHQQQGRSDSMEFGSRANRSELSLTGRSTVRAGEHDRFLDWMSRSGEHISHTPRRGPNRFSDPRLNTQNAVDTERIRLGLDVRTTIMLRNIPNKVNQPLLKAIVDETSLGKYDFMYLRIDFNNNCNVGYAFINFEDPIDIINFVNARAGRTWNCFNSDKVAEVSYATVQGRDCLIQKFRNSSVMLEDREFRPKLFYTGTGPLSGTEEPFPSPDNASKMRRSIENAENIGLFAPRANHQSRLEYRRRRAQIDAGPPVADRQAVYVPTIAPLTPEVNRGLEVAPLTRATINNGLRSAPARVYPDTHRVMWYDEVDDHRGPITS